MKRDRLFPLVVALILGMILCGALLAQSPPYGDPGQPSQGGPVLSAYGTLDSIDTNSFVLRMDDGSTTKYVVDESSSLPPVMTSGDRIGVEYEILGDGGQRTSRLTVLETDRQASVTLGSAAVITPEMDKVQEHEAASAPDDRLPATAGPLPLLALLGALSIIAAAGLRLLSTR